MRASKRTEKAERARETSPTFFFKQHGGRSVAMRVNKKIPGDRKEWSLGLRLGFFFQQEQNHVLRRGLEIVHCQRASVLQQHALW